MPAPYVQYYSKGLQHNALGEVDPAVFQAFEAACRQSDAVGDVGLAFEALPQPMNADRLADPLAAWASGDLGPLHFSQIHLGAPPAISSRSMAVEMAELYWMALLRDVPFAQWVGQADVEAGAAEIESELGAAQGVEPNVLRRGVGRDYPAAKITSGNVFRGTAPGEDVGPFVSQFWLNDTPYGTQTIPHKMVVYEYTNPLPSGAVTEEFLTDFDDWLFAQNSGRARLADGTAGPAYEQSNRAKTPLYKTRVVKTMRDFASFVHRDALHQAYFNAALQLLGMAGRGVIRTSTFDPYNLALNPNAYRHMKGFGTFGGPHLLTLVSEVAARGLQLQWFQKWRVHRRLRPEAFGGLVHVQFVGAGGQKADYGLHASLDATEAAKRIKAKFNGLLLPIAYESGGPTHPSYGAGHATVAGACVTVLKAWFHEADPWPTPQNPPAADDGATTPYNGGGLTVGGELNKLASNVAMGRSMGGVHYRTDNMRSLAVGEILATVVLGKALKHFAERPNGAPPKFGFTNFKGVPVQVDLDQAGRARVVIGGAVDPDQTSLCNDNALAHVDV